MIWPRAKFAELFSIKHGYAFKSQFFDSQGQYALLTPGNFYEEGGFRDVGEKQRFYTGGVPEGFILQEGDLVVVMTEQAEGLLGSPALIPESDRYLHNQRLGLVVGLNEPKLDKKYLYYLFNIREVRHQISSSASGTKVRHTSPGRIEQVETSLPPLTTQLKVASVLSAYEDMMANNLRRMALLEESAQLLYREWFVRLRFPRHEHTHIINGVPDGWEVHKVSEVVKRIPAGKLYSQETALPKGRVPILDQGKSGLIGFHDEEPSVIASTDEPVIVFANHTCYQRVVFYPFSAIQNVLPFISSPEMLKDLFWLHFATCGLIKTNAYKGHWPEFMAKEVLVPPKKITEMFGHYAKENLMLAYILELQNHKLRTARDLLLPKLMSGEIAV